MGIWFDVAAGGAAGMNIDNAANLFRHVTADKTTLYRAIMDVFAAAKRQYRLQLRPDEVLADAAWNGTPPAQEEVAMALAQLAAWGNLESQPDMARVATLSPGARSAGSNRSRREHTAERRL